MPDTLHDSRKRPTRKRPYASTDYDYPFGRQLATGFQPASVSPRRCAIPGGTQAQRVGQDGSGIRVQSTPLYAIDII